ncbi:MAG: nitrilase-related carbon-nitrogen hydrolase [Candidatus Methanomethylophilaceae archaeon]
MKNTRLSMVQINSVVGDYENNFSKIRKFIKKASSSGSNIVCFPEGCLTGYTSSDPKKFSIGLDDPIISKVVEAAADENIAIAFGFMESSGSLPFITHMLVSPSGERICYRKTHLGTYEKGAFSAGDEFPVIELENICLGIHLCWEAHIPDISSLLREKGAELVLIPYSSGSKGINRRTNWMKFLPARAYDYGMYVAACNSVGDNGLGSYFGGGCVILDPKGTVIEEHYEDDEFMITADLPPSLPRNDIDQGMNNISYFDRRRTELFR